jgi:hypothetical protein
MEYTLSMVFNTEAGLKVTFSINDVKPDITEVQANALMDTIIANDVFLPSSGALKSKVSSQMVARNVTKFEVA